MPNYATAAPALVFLVGLSGSGKSIVGGLLAARLGVPFVDTDASIEQGAGRSVVEIFASEGEAGFRARERVAVEAACAMPSGVVATGGGVPIDERNRLAMQRAGTVVWLDAPTDVLVGRLRAQPNGDVRPLLQGDPYGNLQRLRDEREAAYRASSIRVDTSGRTPQAVVEVIMAVLSSTTEALWVSTQ